MNQSPSLQPSAEPALLNAKQVASLIQLSTRAIWRLRSARQMPDSLKVGGAVRWRRAEIEAWIAAGCPPC